MYIGKIIYNNNSYTLTKPKNTQDMNYHLYDKQERKEYLIDIESVWKTADDFDNDDAYILDIDYDNPDNADILKTDYAWKVLDI